MRRKSKRRSRQNDDFSKLRRRTGQPWQPVLLVDIDAQGNATSGVGIAKSSISKDIYDVLVNEEPITDVILHTSHKNLDIVPATIQLSGAEIELTSQIARETRLLTRLRQSKTNMTLF